MKYVGEDEISKFIKFEEAEAAQVIEKPVQRYIDDIPSYWTKCTCYQEELTGNELSCICEIKIIDRRTDEQKEYEKYLKDKDDKEYNKIIELRRSFMKQEIEKE